MSAGDDRYAVDTDSLAYGGVNLKQVGANAGDLKDFFDWLVTMAPAAFGPLDDRVGGPPRGQFVGAAEYGKDACGGVCDAIEGKGQSTLDASNLADNVDDTATSTATGKRV